MSKLTDAAGIIKGNPNKAKIILVRKPAQSSGKGKNIADTALSALSKAVNSVQSSAGASQDGYYPMEVHYNPSSISISTKAGNSPLQSIQNGSDQNGLIIQETVPTECILSVALIFDAVDVKDSFMLEKVRASAGDVVQDVKAVAVSAIKGGFSVKSEINSFIGMVMREDTRHIIFQWANMSFYGEINDVEAVYTMFNISGEPVRGRVKISIRQDGAGNLEAAYWQKALDKCFGKAGQSKEIQAKAFTQKIGSVINLNL